MDKPPVMKQSRAKLWIRAAIFIFFGVLFAVALYNDITRGIFPLWGVVIVLIPAILFGFWISRFVPMKVHQAHGVVTLSFDFIYLVLIVVLVVIKVLAGMMSGWEIIADIIMVFILGMMFGRIGGIGLRVRGLKKEHNLL